MSLVLTGKVLDFSRETVDGPSGSFVSEEVSLLVGKARVETVRLGRDFEGSKAFEEGTEVGVEVVVTAFARRAGGAGYRLTGMKRVEPGRRVASVPSPAAVGGN